MIKMEKEIQNKYMQLQMLEQQSKQLQEQVQQHEKLLGKVLEFLGH